MPCHRRSKKVVTLFMSSLLSRAGGVSTCDGLKRPRRLNSSSVAAPDSGIKSTVHLTLRYPHLGGYAGVCLGEALHLGPDDCERDTTLEPHARWTRINEAGACNSWMVRLRNRQQRLQPLHRRP